MLRLKAGSTGLCYQIKKSCVKVRKSNYILKLLNAYFIEDIKDRFFTYNGLS